jgi:hypothetical protein
MAQRKLPNLQRLMERGSSGIMKSYMPPVSPVLWASIATGTLPSKHGVKNFTSIRIPGVATPLNELPRAVLIGKLLRSRRAHWEAPVSSDTFQRPAFWQIASQLGGTVGVVGWWGSWPALEVNGFVVTDRVVYHPSNTNVDDLDSVRGLTWPEPLFAAIRDQIRDPDSVTLEEAREFIDVKQLKPGYRTPHDPEHLFKIALTMSESYRKIGLDLYRKTKPDVFAIYFQGTDLVSHYMWQYGFPHEFENVPPGDVRAYGECIRRFYTYQDRILGEFVAAADENTCIIVLSDHGFATDPHPDKPTHTGKHDLEGMCVFAGAGVKPGGEFATTPHDVAPTLLAITGTTLSQDMDGRVLTEVVAPETLRRFPVRYVPRYPDHYLVARDWKSTETDREITERLKALGYLQ